MAAPIPSWPEASPRLKTTPVVAIRSLRDGKGKIKTLLGFLTYTVSNGRGTDPAGDAVRFIPGGAAHMSDRLPKSDGDLFIQASSRPRSPVAKVAGARPARRVEV